MKTILIVDDEPFIRELLTDFLSMQGYKVVQAADGNEGFDKFNKYNPEAAILDVEMPGMNGQELSHKIFAVNKNFPVIIISAFLFKYSKTDFINNGVRAVLEKPVNLNLIKQNLNEIFENTN
ncbi:MAG: response regulator [Calditrichaceae bacterium]|jgi:two-component system, NtrC family, nitrogen regulation response regulator NtrX